MEDRRLVASVDAACARAVARAGAAVACRRGCTACCIGPFEISAADGWRLERGLRRLAAMDAPAARALRRRAGASWSRMRRSFPGEGGRLGGDEAARETFFEAFGEEPCPVLDPESGACLLYRWRPLACRVQGVPGRYGEVVVPACRLNFIGSAPAVAAAATVDVDPDDAEAAVLAGLEAAGAGVGDTIVAAAVRAPGGLRGGVDKDAEKENSSLRC